MLIPIIKYMSFSPWVEKYRPQNLNDVVLDNTNKTILNNIIKKSYFPNLLLYGPPGTGKTTTIINLIKAYQKSLNKENKKYMIHLNASDDRGIEIIRNQIYQFVHTKTLFGTGLKFVILDEVDYMTKNAQQALKHLIQQFSSNVRFCLICNYISRIDNALQNEFIRLRFCQLPKKEINTFLKNIITNEKLNITDNHLISIQETFKSDIRSMINYIQSNYNKFIFDTKCNYINNNLWEILISKFKTDSSEDIIEFINKLNREYYIEKIDLVNKFIKFIIKTKKYAKNDEWIKVFKFIVHSEVRNIEYIVKYLVYNLKELYKSL
jgi:DNA polymerase III delta prime subunit